MGQPGQPGSLTGQIVGEYQLGPLLGVGGMAEVYRAQDLSLNREVAVKVVAPRYALDPEYVSRFRAEARRASAVHHPNIMPVYAYGEEQGLLYLVMPLLDQSLRDVLDRQGKLPEPQAVRITLEIAAALEVAHAQGLIHRDVKPANILLDADGNALLTDFGIAREVADPRDPAGPKTLSASGMPVGTPEYMAPEQFDDVTQVDQRADVYALGVVLYEALTGAPPFRAPSPYGVASLVMTTPPEPPSSRDPQIGPQLEHAILRALAKRPDDRYRDIREFASALRQINQATVPSPVVSSSPVSPPSASSSATNPASWMMGQRPATPSQIPTPPETPIAASRFASPTAPPIAAQVARAGAMSGAMSGAAPDDVTTPGMGYRRPLQPSAPPLTVADALRTNAQRRTRRTFLLLVAASLLVISLGVCGGGLFLTGAGQLFGLGGGNGNLHGGAATVTSSSGGGSITPGATNTSAQATHAAQAGQTPGATTTTTTTANPSVTATGTATGTATASPTGTVTPTDTPTVAPTPTATPVPPTPTPTPCFILCL